MQPSNLCLGPASDKVTFVQLAFKFEGFLSNVRGVKKSPTSRDRLIINQVMYTNYSAQKLK